MAKAKVKADAKTKLPMAVLSSSQNTAKMLMKSGVRPAVGREEVTKYFAGPPLLHPSLEYLFGLTVFPYSTLVHIYGPSGCGKTTLGLDLLNRFSMSIGGRGVVVENEQKLSAEVLYGIIGDMHSEQLIVANADDLESTQAAITLYAEEVLTKTFGKKADRSNAYCQLGMIDSFRVLCRATKDKLKKSKFAVASFAVEANLWRQYLGAYVGMQNRAPLGLIVINHLVEKTNKMGMLVEDTGGGKALHFYSAYEISVKKVRKVKNKTMCFTDLCLCTTKNSNGVDKQKIYPRIWYDSPDLEPGRFKVDWSQADAVLLSGSMIPRDQLAKQGICNTKVSSDNDQLFSDSILGLTKVPITEIVSALYADPERLKAFRKLLSISTAYHTFEELWENGWYQHASFIHTELNVA